MLVNCRILGGGGDLHRAVLLGLLDRLLRPFAGIDIVGDGSAPRAGSSARWRSPRSRLPAGRARCSRPGSRAACGNRLPPWSAMPMNSLPRWLISITDMPLPCQSSISAAACASTLSGSAAGPALKLKTRIRWFQELIGNSGGGAARDQPSSPTLPTHGQPRHGIDVPSRRFRPDSPAHGGSGDGPHGQF